MSDSGKGLPICIKVADVISKIAEMGYGSMSTDDWQHMVQFRLFLPSAVADMLKDCLFQVCNGRISTPAETYSLIHNLHPKKYEWIKVFLIVETYCMDLLHEEHGEHKAISHTGPHAKVVKTLDKKAITLLSMEKELLEEVTDFFGNVLQHYDVDPHESVSPAKMLLANATLMKALGRTVWKVADNLLNHKKKVIIR